MNKNPKVIIIGGLITVLVVVFIGYSLMTKGKSQEKSTSAPTPTEQLIPTVDSNVKVDLAKKSTGKEVTLLVQGIPKGTTSIEYELSYNTIRQGIQGVLGTVILEGSETEYEKDLTLGTCSSGTCVYHDVEGKITLSLRFTGSYGEKVYQKEYDL